MTGKSYGWIAAALVLAVLACTSAFAADYSKQYSKEFETNFLGSCQRGCSQNANVPPSSRKLCQPYCNCALGEVEHRLTYEQALQADEDARTNTNTPRMQAMREGFAQCNARIFK